MTQFNYRDSDLHDGDSHRLAGNDPAFNRRLALHHIAHEINDSGGPVSRPIAGDHPDGMDPWLVDIHDRVDSVLGARVRVLLRSHRIHQAQFARDLGLTLGALSDRLHGRVPFSLAEALYLCEQFGIDIDDLLGRATA